MFVNPPHYTVYLGDSENVELRNVKSFSCEGWSDGLKAQTLEQMNVQVGDFVDNVVYL